MLKQIQKQLTQIDKTTSISNKQQIVIRQLLVQVKALQKQLDKIGGSVIRIKNIPTNKRKGARNKRTKKWIQILLILISVHHQCSCQKTTTWDFTILIS